MMIANIVTYKGLLEFSYCLPISIVVFYCILFCGVPNELFDELLGDKSTNV